MTVAISGPRVARRWTGEDLDRMIDAGIVREGTNAYLWDGEILEPMAEDQPHDLAVKGLRKLLESRFPEAEWSVNPSQPVDLREGFRPQPDLVVLRGPDANFAGRGNRPKASDVALLVEVSGSTYADDKGNVPPRIRPDGDSSILDRSPRGAVRRSLHRAGSRWWSLRGLHGVWGRESCSPGLTARGI